MPKIISPLTHPQVSVGNPADAAALEPYLSRTFRSPLLLEATQQILRGNNLHSIQIAFSNIKVQVARDPEAIEKMTNYER